MRNSGIVRAMTGAFLMFVGGMSLWKMFVMPGMSRYVVVGSSIAFAFYIGVLRGRQTTR